MTDPIFFDTDCLSAFLWVNNQSLLAQLYPGRVAIPDAVYSELSNPHISHLRERVDAMISAGNARICDIQTGTAEYELYRKLTSNPSIGRMIIGRGEAAGIVLAKSRGGILASNNLRDISSYINEFSLQHVTTGDILKEALEQGLITEDAGNQLWQGMLRKRRRLGYQTSSDFLASHT